jgi:hypothetical protein
MVRATRDVCLRAQGVDRHPHAITITGGDAVVRDGPLHTRVPKRELVGLLVRLFQTERLRVASSLELAGVLVNELVNFKVKVSLKTGHDSYESWRESIHDDLVLATALACWHAAKPIVDSSPAVGPVKWSPGHRLYTPPVRS